MTARGGSRGVLAAVAAVALAGAAVAAPGVLRTGDPAAPDGAGPTGAGPTGTGSTGSGTPTGPGAAGGTTPPPVPFPVSGAGSATASGVRLDAEVAPGAAAGDPSSLRVAVVDEVTGAPVAGTSAPLVWAGLRRPGTEAETCDRTAARLRRTGPGERADVDLGGYSVVTLDDAPTLSVLDPAVDVGGITRLSAMPRLSGRGEDWVAGRDGRRLYVTVPSSGTVAAVDTTTFQVVAEADAGPGPTAVALDPTGERLWVSNDPGGGRGGVTVLDVDDLRPVGSLTTGPAPLRVLFPAGGTAPAAGHGGHGPGADAPEPGPGSPPGRALVVHGDGAVVAVDGASLARVATRRLPRPVTAAVAVPGADRVHVALDGGGLLVLDGTGTRVAAADGVRGVRTLAAAPDGSAVLALSPSPGRLTVVDPATAAVRSETPLSGGPDDVVFTGGYAYVRLPGESGLAVLPVADLAGRGALAPVRVGVGESAPAGARATASALAPVHGHGVLVAHPADRYVYLYMPGMNAPMGGFRTDGRVPRAVTVVDRAPREQSPGVFTAAFPVPSAGTYDVAVVLDEPRVLACLTATAQEPAGRAEPAPPPAALTVLEVQGPVPVGVPVPLRLALHDAEGRPVVGVEDLGVVATHAAGTGDARGRATPRADGTYDVELVLPREGPYLLRAASPGRGLDLGDLPAVGLEAQEPGR